MIVTFDVQLKGLAALSRSDINDCLKSAFYAIGLRWRNVYLPLHFGEGAAARYHYAPRAGDPGNYRKNYKSSYQGRKYKLFGHTRPLEYTGALKEEALSDGRVTSTRFYCRIPLPRGFNRRSVGQKANMADEVRKVLVSERKDLARHLKQQLINQIRAKGSSGGATVRIVSGAAPTAAAA
jgi:hypothetical protein